MTSSNVEVSHHDCEVAELRAEPRLAVEYLKIALRALDNPVEHAAGLAALAVLIEAYGDLASLQELAGLDAQALNGAVEALQARVSPGAAPNA